MLRIFEFQLEKWKEKIKVSINFFKKISEIQYIQTQLLTVKTHISHFYDFFKNMLKHVTKTFHHDANFRLSEIILICDLEYLIRHNLANGDNSHNEVKYIQSYTGMLFVMEVV